MFGDADVAEDEVGEEVHFEMTEVRISGVGFLSPSVLMHVGILCITICLY